MGTLGESGLSEKLWGSKTAAVIGKTKIPVMVVPYDYEWKAPKNILLASNHFEKEPALLDGLFEMALKLNANVQVAVITDDDFDHADVVLEHSRQTPEYEKFLKTKYNADSLTATHLSGKGFEETLQKYIHEKDIDIVAMITYQNKRSFWDRLFHPSETKRMSYHTKIPLLAIPAK